MTDDHCHDERPELESKRKEIHKLYGDVCSFGLDSIETKLHEIRTCCSLSPSEKATFTNEMMDVCEEGLNNIELNHLSRHGINQKESIRPRSQEL